MIKYASFSMNVSSPVRTVVASVYKAKHSLKKGEKTNSK